MPEYVQNKSGADSSLHLACLAIAANSTLKYLKPLESPSYSQ